MKILLEIYDILKNIKYIKRNTIAFHEYYDLYKILMKIKNIAVAFLVLLVVLTTKKTKNPPMWTILLLPRRWNTKIVTKPLPIRTILLLSRP